MKDTVYFKDKRITVVGLARSGIVCAHLLHELGAAVSVTDSRDAPATRAARERLSSRDIAVELGGHTRGFIEGRDLVVVSPGVEDASPPVRWAEELGIAVVSEIEVAGMLCPAPVIAVTGSNGKTTVTTLIGRILQAGGKSAVVCGNIGNPFCGELRRIAPDDYVCLEVSSFQLERIRTFKPWISLILNVTPNHLDRYSGMAEYVQAKKRIFLNQGAGDYLILNRDDPALMTMAKEAACTVRYFSSKEKDRNPNQAAVLEVARIVGIPDERAVEVFAAFKGIEHRLEFVERVDGVTFINDSKATTADSALWALKNIPGPIVLIAGGKHKGIDYGVVVPDAAAKVKRAVLIGEAKGLIAAALRGRVETEEAATLPDAVRTAFRHAVPGDYVLLSPMCSSFDMFSDYEERGRVFKDAVRELAARKDTPDRRL